MHVTMRRTEDRRLDRRARVRGSSVREVHQLRHERVHHPHRTRTGIRRHRPDQSQPPTDAAPEAARLTLAKFGSRCGQNAWLRSAARVDALLHGRFISFTRLLTRRRSLVYRIQSNHPSGLRPGRLPVDRRLPDVVDDEERAAQTRGPRQPAAIERSDPPVLVHHPERGPGVWVLDPGDV